MKPEEALTDKEMKINYSYLVGDSYYVLLDSEGLFEFVNAKSRFTPVSGRRELTSGRMHVMLPGEDEGTILLGPFDGGLYILNKDKNNNKQTDESLEPFSPSTSPGNIFLRENELYAGVRLDDRTYMFGTSMGGLLHMGRKGEVLRILNRDFGLPSNFVTAVFVDKDDNIWLTPELGITFIDRRRSALTFYTGENSQLGYVTAILRHQAEDREYLYASGHGVFFLDEDKSIFKAIDMGTGISQCFALLSVDNVVLAAAAEEGVYEINKINTSVAWKEEGMKFAAVSLHKSAIDNKLIFVGLYNGLSVLRRTSTGWKPATKIEPETIDQYIYTIEEQEPGVLWLGTFSQGLIRVRYDVDDGTLMILEVNRFGKKDGLVDGQILSYHADKEVLFLTHDGISVLDKKEKRFKEHRTLRGIETYEDTLMQDRRGNIWMTSDSEIRLFRKQDDSYEEDHSLVRKFPNKTIFSIYPDPVNDVVWFGSMDGIIRYELPEKEAAAQEMGQEIKSIKGAAGTYAYKTIIRDVYRIMEIPGKDKEMKREDKEMKLRMNSKESGIVEIRPLDEDRLRIEYAAPTFSKPDGNRFRSILKREGSLTSRREEEEVDQGWSALSTDTYRDYSNLPAGDYGFMVKAENIFGEEGEVAEYEFRILPRWYEMIRVRLSFAVLFLLGLYLLFRWRTHQLRERKKILEKTVKERTRVLKERTRVLKERTRVLEETQGQMEQLHEIGRDITSILDTDNIVAAVYDNINSMMDADMFAIGVYNDKEKRINMRGKEAGKDLGEFYYELGDERPAVYCFKNQEEIVSGDYPEEFPKYVSKRKETVRGVHSRSLVYLPLSTKGNRIGVLTAQSIQKKNAYTEYHLNVLRNMATYIAIALDNALRREQLMKQERLALLGTLAVGIAHETRNPLNFIINFAEGLVELVSELLGALGDMRGETQQKQALMEIGGTMEVVARKIIHHGNRIHGVVKNMLKHPRRDAVERRLTDVNALLEQAVRLAYHSMRAVDSSFNVTIIEDFDPGVGEVELVSQEVNSVFLNLTGNGFYALSKRTNDAIRNAEEYEPTLRVSTRKKDGFIEIKIRDNGTGIAEQHKERIFERFFTTKPTGEGAGLGLFISRRVIEGTHGGSIKFNSEYGKYTEFVVMLPAHRSLEEENGVRRGDIWQGEDVRE
ncbi:MAG: GAF domain-containing protein [Proteobacteria bacterium]|nr:GAF domain-containing protein [Pseudomonadota bacterium]